MIDRRMVTDIGLALLIASPAILPAAPAPWTADDNAGKPSVVTEQSQVRTSFAEAGPGAQSRS